MTPSRPKAISNLTSSAPKQKHKTYHPASQSILDKDCCTDVREEKRNKSPAKKEAEKEGYNRIKAAFPPFIVKIYR